MSSGKPIVRQIAWLSIIPQFFVMGVLVVVFILLVKPFTLAIILAMTVYLVTSFILEHYVPYHHRKGILLYKQGNYVQAIEEYKKSYDFFCRHSWIDKYRYLTLLSSSKLSYTEMALMNIAFCYVLCQNVKLAKEYCQKVLELFPDSEMAKSTLYTISLYENKSDGFDNESTSE